MGTTRNLGAPPLQKAARRVLSYVLVIVLALAVPALTLFAYTLGLSHSQTVTVTAEVTRETVRLQQIAVTVLVSTTPVPTVPATVTGTPSPVPTCPALPAGGVAAECERLRIQGEVGRRGLGGGSASRARVVPLARSACRLPATL